MDRMTDEQAAALLKRLDDLSDKLTATEQQSETNRKLAVESKAVADRNKWIVRGVLLLVVVVAFFVNEQREDGKDLAEAQDDIRATQVQTCENGNVQRSAQRLAWTELLTVSDASAEAQGVAKDSPIRVYYRAYITWIATEVFPPRDCTDLDKAIPEPGPAPSFEEALQESLKD